MPHPDDGAPIIQITADDRPTPLCDFCNTPNPTWDYPCAFFELPEYRNQSNGGWAACDSCSAIVESGDKLALLAIGYGAVSEPETMDVAVQKMRFLMALYDGFFSHRQGPRIAYYHEPIA